MELARVKEERRAMAAAREQEREQEKNDEKNVSIL